MKKFFLAACFLLASVAGFAQKLTADQEKEHAEIFYNQAQLIAGLPIDDPTAYTDLLCSLWQ